MNIGTQLQELDNLIVEHTTPPVTAMLRNKLAFCIQQAEARAADVERQEQTLARQIETINRLVKEKSDIEKEYSDFKAKLEASNTDWLDAEVKKHREAERKRTPYY